MERIIVIITTTERIQIYLLVEIPVEIVRVGYLRRYLEISIDIGVEVI